MAFVVKTWSWTAAAPNGEFPVYLGRKDVHNSVAMAERYATVDDARAAAVYRLTSKCKFAVVEIPDPVEQ